MGSKFPYHMLFSFFFIAYALPETAFSDLTTILLQQVISLQNNEGRLSLSCRISRRNRSNFEAKMTRMSFLASPGTDA
jgi:hypothetical protein